MVRPNWLKGLLRTAAVAVVVLAATAGSTRAEDCSGETFPSTFALIEKVIFENRGCTNSICHGDAQAGGLDLRAGAYERLVDVAATSVPAMTRVLAGQKERSLLWINLAAKTYPDEYTAPLRAMPQDPLPALTPDELEAVRLWIEKGASKEGVVPKTDKLLNACLPPPEPLVVKPLPPPEAGKGAQIVMPPWTLRAQSEREVCFASYYDLTDQVPPQFRGPDGTTFRYKFNQVRQTPLSHHLIVNLYAGSAAPDDPEWGTFTCKGGPRAGETCNATDLAFCAPGLCATDPVTSVACINFGPGDGGLGISSVGFTGTQETAAEFNFAPGVYREVPLKGMIMWNSHAFDLTDKDGLLEAWLNFEFAAPDEQETPARQIFDTNEIFKMNVPAFSTEEVCNIHVLPREANLYELSSHAHQRMKRWHTFLGAFTCESGPNAGAPCTPFGKDFDSPDLCAGARCVSMTRPPVGDCDLDETVTVDELVTCVNIALGSLPPDACSEADNNADAEVSIDEVITGVNAALNGVPPPTERDPEHSLMYTNLNYNDPVVLRIDPPLVFSRPNSADRSLTYCALYDNGFINPDDVKTRAGSPKAPFQGVPGGPCATPTHCTQGKVGAPCAGNSERSRNASCDTASAAGSGKCDACPLRGGVTTQDEMFLLMGQFFVR